MNTYVALLRGINVGGKNKVPMAALRAYLEELGFRDVVTYIASGNVILKSDKTAGEVTALIERALPNRFTLDSNVIKVLVLSHSQLRAIVQQKPSGFGDTPNMFHSDAIFLMDIDASKALKVFHPREGIDTIWPGDGVIYSQRLSAERTKSRLSKIIGTPEYQHMTIRNWNTITTLLGMFEATVQ